MNNEIIRLLSQPAISLPLLAWSFFWKGWALWRAAGKKQLPWFVILIILNTMGLLEIAYIFYLDRFDIDQGKALKFLEKKFKKLR